MQDSDTQSLIASIINSSLTGQKLVNSFQIPKTVSGNLYSLTTEKDEYVVKLATSQAQIDALCKEVEVYRLIKAQGIPIPEVLDINKLPNGSEYILMKKLAGDALGRAFDVLTETQRASIYYGLGKLVAKLNSITSDQFGDIWLSENRFSSWSDMLSSILNKYKESLHTSTFSELTDKALDYIQANLFSDEQTPRLIHGDLHQINVFISDGQISGILDVDTAMFASPKLELARIRYTHFRQMAPEYERNFNEGYASVFGDMEELLADVKAYDLLMYVDQAYRLAASIEPNEKYISRHKEAFETYLNQLTSS